MTLDQALSFGLMALAVALFVWGRLRYDLVALCVLVLGVILGVVPVEEMFTGFSNELIWIIASALLMSAAIARSGVVERALAPVLNRITSPNLTILAFVAAVILLSMLVKNIGALAIVMPVAIQTARKTGLPVSRLLMPMAFGSLMGGLVTLVGTSPNVVVSSVRESLLGEPYALFDFAPVGLGVCLVGFLFLSIAPRFIRIDRTPTPGVEAALDATRYVTELTIPEDEHWVGEPFESLTKLADSSIEIMSYVSGGKSTKGLPDQPIAAGDKLIIEGEQAELQKFAASAKLEFVGERHREEKEKSDEVRVVEGIIAPDSPLAGHSVSQARLHERFGVSLLAVSRSGSRIAKELRALRLRSGDVVIFKADEGQVGEAFSELRVLPLSGRPVSLGLKPVGYAPIILLGVAMFVVGMGWAPIELALIAAALMVLLLRILTMEEAYRSIDGGLLVLLAALIPLSESIERTGGAALIAAPLSSLLGPMPPMLAIGALVAVGMAVTPFLNNAATVLIVAPIAATIATELNVNPDAYLMAVAIGAACDFLTPIGHQCNTLVMGPGGYRFGDYWKLGLPLSILVILTATPLIAMVWGGPAPALPPAP